MEWVKEGVYRLRARWEYIASREWLARHLRWAEQGAKANGALASYHETLYRRWEGTYGPRRWIDGRRFWVW